MKTKIISYDEYLTKSKHETLEPIEYEGHTIPAGTITDGASVPNVLTLVGVALLIINAFIASWTLLILGSFLALLNSVIPARGKGYTMPSALHDFLWTTGNHQYANQEFKRTLELEGVNRFRIFILMAGVNINAARYRWGFGPKK